MVMVNVNSSLYKDILTLQQSVDTVQVNNFIGKKMTELRPRYFQIKNFKAAFMKEYKDFLSCKYNAALMLICFRVQLEKGILP